jgi:hypothetical protein
MPSMPFLLLKPERITPQMFTDERDYQLYLAVITNRHDKMQMHLDQGANPHGYGTALITPLYGAIINHQESDSVTLQKLQLLLRDESPFPNSHRAYSRPTESTLVCQLAHAGKFKCVAFLLSKGAEYVTCPHKNCVPLSSIISMHSKIFESDALYSLVEKLLKTEAAKGIKKADYLDALITLTQSIASFNQGSIVGAILTPFITRYHEYTKKLLTYCLRDLMEIQIILIQAMHLPCIEPPCHRDLFLYGT